MRDENKVSQDEQKPFISEIYGSFFLDKTELVINVDHVQEVVNYPENIITMPLSPDFMVGVFNLRGVIVPVINIKKLLKFSATEISKTSKIAILEYQGANVGLVFDSTGEILRSREEEKSDFKYSGESQHNVIKGALKLDGGARILQILDPQALVTIENIPQLLASKATQNKNSSFFTSQHGHRKKCITFTVNGSKMAFEIKGIHEIVNVPELQHSALESDLCLGMISLRGQVVPVINFAALLKYDPAPAEPNSASRIIVLRLEHNFVGLQVDSIESIDSYSTDNIMPIPLLSKERAGMFFGCITVPDCGDVFLLHHEQVLSNAEILEVTHGHSHLYRAEDIKSDAKKSRGLRQSYISFRLVHLFGFPIKVVKEIINYSPEIFQAPGMPSIVRGVMNLRGQLVTVIDTRQIYSLSAFDEAMVNNSKILIFQRGEDLFGLVVDSVENILTLDESAKVKIPDILINGAEGNFHQDISEVVEVPGREGKNATLIILNVDPLISRVHQAKTA